MFNKKIKKQNGKKDIINDTRSDEEDEWSLLLLKDLYIPQEPWNFLLQFTVITASLIDF